MPNAFSNFIPNFFRNIASYLSQDLQIEGTERHYATTEVSTLHSTKSLFLFRSCAQNQEFEEAIADELTRCQIFLSECLQRSQKLNLYALRQQGLFRDARPSKYIQKAYQEDFTKHNACRTSFFSEVQGFGAVYSLEKAGW